jgi:DDE superfamily endonuclease
LHPKANEDSYVDCHHNLSLNLAVVAGPEREIYFVPSNCSCRSHDSSILHDSALWQTYEIPNKFQFPACVILGDSAYPVRKCSMKPFKGERVRAKLCFNNSQAKTRVIVEQTLGVLKRNVLHIKNWNL